jgi:hypothetical protein
VAYEEGERVLDDRVQSEASRREFVATSAPVSVAAASGTQKAGMLAQLPPPTSTPTLARSPR